MLAASALLLTTALSGCAGVMPGAPGSQPPASVQADPRLVSAQIRFGLNLFQHLRAEKPAQSLFVSPSSVSLALSMTYNGARGETREAMARALSVEGLSTEEVNAGNRSLQALLASPDPKVEVSVANSIWYQKGFQVSPGFLNTVKTFYQAAAEPVDFAGPGAAPTINRWVAQATRQKIPTIVDQTRPEDRMYLVNAIYFNGKWQTPFDPKLTRPGPFHRPDGSTVEHPMMTRSGRFRHLKGDGFQAAALPYGEGNLSLYVFLPDESAGADRFYQQMTPENWNTWMKGFAAREGSLTMPKVKLSYTKELSPAMKALGMGVAFSDAADFSGLFDGAREPLAISFILHKTHLDLDEKGTEAAAVTAVGISVTSAPAPDSRFTMVVDRPFFLAIRDDRSGAVLFMGSLTDPSATS